MMFGKVCRCSLMSIALLGMVAVGAQAQDFSFEMVPVGVVGGNPPGTVISGNEITLATTGVTVEFEIQAPWSGFTSASTQFKIDAVAGYASGTGTPLNSLGYPANPGHGGYITAQRCLFSGRHGCNTSPSNNIAPCDLLNPADGPCVGYSRYIYPETAPIAVVAFPSADFEYLSVSQTGGHPADPVRVYAGTLKVEVPAGAAGTYTIGFINDPNTTFMTDENVQPQPLTALVPGQITLPEYACCLSFGPGAPCQDLTQGQCTGQGGTSFVGQTCADQPDVCEGCLNDAACDDGDACTNDDCVIPQGQSAGECVNTVNFNTATRCCDPATGTVANPNDGDQCTIDTCSITAPGPNAGDGRGTVSNPVDVGASCDDGRACFVDDTCQSDGSCEGTDLNTVACVDDNDCPAPSSGCDVAAGFCECSEDTPLCIEFTPGSLPDPNCYEAGEIVNAQVAIGAGSEEIAGGQFLIEYDPACLDLVSIGPCAGSIFTQVVQVDVDEANGVIWYAVAAETPAFGDPIDTTTGPYDIACLQFVKTDDCNECDVCFADNNPRNTMLANADGNQVPLDNCGCSKLVRRNGGIDLDTPMGGAFNADCNRTTYLANWNAPAATDECEGDLAVVCQAEHDGGLPISQNMIMNGGTMPQGTTFFTCTASNSCGDSSTNVWTVQVSSETAMDVEVELCGNASAATFERCVNFDVYTDCVSDPDSYCETMTFGGPLNFRDHATATLKLGKDNFACIAAQDILHTLRACDTPVCVPADSNGDGVRDGSGRWTALWKGDHSLGGNCLLGGNLDAWKPGISFSNANVINILDFVMLMSEVAAAKAYPPRGDTVCDPLTCTLPGPHGDLNADGAVDAGDFTYILENFLADSKECCCPSPLADDAGMITSITVKELRQMGLGDMTMADLNSDGVVDMDDMGLYMQGVDPQPTSINRGGKTRGSSR